MTESWRQTMDLGLVHFMAFPVIKDEGPILETAEMIARDDFFDVLEVRRSEQPGMHAKLRALAEMSGLRLGVGAQPGLLLNKLSLNDPDDAGRAAAVAEVKKSIDAAYELGAALCVCLTGPDPGDDDQRKREMDLLVDSLVEICKYSQDKADDKPVWLSVEIFDDAVDKRCLLGPSTRSAEVAARVREQVPNFGLTYDLSHMPMLGENAADAFTTLGEYLIHIHVGNCQIDNKDDETYGDMHPRFGYPNSRNDIPELKEFVQSLIYSGYFDREVPTVKPVVTFEVKPYGEETSEMIIAHTKRTWMRMWAEL